MGKRILKPESSAISLQRGATPAAGHLSGQSDPLAPISCPLDARLRTPLGLTASGKGIASGGSAQAQAAVLRLQRQYGNRYVQRTLALARQGEGESKVAPEIESAIQGARGAGQALDSTVRARMEAAFGADFGGVRVHTDALADHLNQALSARAFTTGQDIFFSQDQYRPASYSGQELLAHELTHVVQQTGNGLRGKLTVSQPGDACEREADQVAGAVMGRLYRPPEAAAVSMQPRIQRRPTVVPAPFIGGSPFNDSDVTFTPRGALLVGGVETSSTDFPSGGEGTLQIRAETAGTVQLSMNVEVFEDNIFINESWSQSFSVSWNVAAARDGSLRIDSPVPTVNARSGSITQSALGSINPAQGLNFVAVSPVIQGASATGGISLGVGLETNFPGSFLQRSFKLNIEVIDIPAPQVIIGPISTLRSHPVLFERPAQSRVSGQQEAQLLGWYESLTEVAKARIRAGEEPVSLVGHASTTGGAAMNRELSNSRMESVQRVLRQYIGSEARFTSRAVGEYQAATGENIESAEERKVVVSVWEQAK